jgi:hypothetical protein
MYEVVTCSSLTIEAPRAFKHPREQTAAISLVI